jgi:hypothetical protein
VSIIISSWREEDPTPPPADLVALMIRKASSYHCVTSDLKLVYDYRWAKAGEEPASYDRKCWHLRDDLSRATQCSRGVEDCQGMMEGLREGYELGLKAPRPKTPPTPKLRKKLA